jgi:site-specific DNA-methyltransferase (adenine-specific)
MGVMHAALDRTTLTVCHGDSRGLSWIAPGSVHLALTSPPYWTLKEYPSCEGQLGLVEDYEALHDELDKVWKLCFRVLVPGGRLVCIVGDVCLSRRKHGRHSVTPLHADIIVRARRIGFDNLTPILWHKITNASHEVDNGTGFLGKPYEPNAIVKNDVEFILMLRKPGGYRQPTAEQWEASRLTKQEHHEWFRRVWNGPRGESTRRHPAPFPEELAHRLVRMFSFTGDTVLDPFMGTGTSLLASARCGRNAIGVDIEPAYVRMAKGRIEKELATCFRRETGMAIPLPSECGGTAPLPEPNAAATCALLSRQDALGSSLLTSSTRD